MDKKQFKNSMKVTCFKSLAYCCNKECESRNKALKNLGLSKTEFKKWKNSMDKVLLSYINGRRENGTRIRKKHRNARK